VLYVQSDLVVVSPDKNRAGLPIMRPPNKHLEVVVLSILVDRGPSTGIRVRAIGPVTQT
jgi:hypothetical protein